MAKIANLGIKNIGIKEFRQNISKVADQVQDRKYRFIVHRKNKPIFELRPMTERELYIDEVRQKINNAKKTKAYTVEEVVKLLGGTLEERINEGLADIKAGRVYTLEEVRKNLGL